MRRTLRQFAGQSAAILLVLLAAAGCTSRQAGLTAVDPDSGRSGLETDSRLAKYAEYLKGVEKLVVTRWYELNDKSRVSPPRGSHVTVTFKLTAKGETEITKVEDAGCGKQGVWICESAIQDFQPFPRWTPEMIAVLGEEQTLVFGFYYQ